MISNLGDEFARLAWLLSTQRESVSRRSLERAWDNAVIRRQWERADRIFDLLYPGVFEEDLYTIVTE